MKRKSTIADMKRSSDFPKAGAITPRDDAFHGSINVVDIEWWYFDAVFDNGYSVTVALRTIHRGKSGVMRSCIEVYKDGKAEVEVVKTYLFRDFHTSGSIPFVRLGDKTVVEFDEERYNKTGEWRYHVSLKIDDYAVDLTFTGITKGWKIETPKNSWAVPLPKAKVDGTITVHGTTMLVQGVGYHDHNWDYSLLTTWVKNRGWYWGRIIGKTVNVSWAKTIESKDISTLLAIVNQEKTAPSGEGDFFPIHPDNITLVVNNFISDHRQWIPTEFILRVTETSSENHVPVDIHLAMSVEEVRHSKIFTAHYWRYHVKATGTISVGSTTETLKDAMQIIELLSFKSQGRKP